jgi:hypothetical protein
LKERHENQDITLLKGIYTMKDIGVSKDMVNTCLLLTIESHFWFENLTFSQYFKVTCLEDQ